MRYGFGGLIFGGACTWRGLFSKFYGNLIVRRDTDDNEIPSNHDPEGVERRKRRRLKLREGDIGHSWSELFTTFMER